MKKPTVSQYIRYCCGAVLPPDLHEWVRNDLAGHGATRRLIVRYTVPLMIALSPIFFVPIDWMTRVTMYVPLVLPFVFFSFALSPIYRRYRLNKHGLDGDLVDHIKKQKLAPDMEAYYARYRPEMSKNEETNP